MPLTISPSNVKYLIASIVLLLTQDNYGSIALPVCAFTTDSLQIHERVVKTTVIKRRSVIRLELSSDNNSPAQENQFNSNQDRLLQEILDIKPESTAERQSRISERLNAKRRLEEEKLNNIGVAILSVLAALLNFGYQYTHPVTSLSLLSSMQDKSVDINVIGNNGRPTVVDFWAPWCENCKVTAPTLKSVEDEYGDRVNFIMVNGDLRTNGALIERFGVDAIPHLALISSDGFIETSLIGLVPRSVLRTDLDVLIQNAHSTNSANTELQNRNKPNGQGKIELPYKMFDAFEGRPNLKQISF